MSRLGMGRFFWGIALLAAASSAGRGAEAGPWRVVATTMMVAELVRDVGGERVQVESLMGPGVDPHLYKATTADIVKLQQAQAIFYNGLMLEGKMSELFARMARTKRGRVYAVTANLPESRLLRSAGGDGPADPHVWFDVPLWSQCLSAVAEALAELDPAGRAFYRSNADAAERRLQELHAWALAKAAELPPEQRILITSHDAFGYFGRAYGFQVLGLQGISTVSEAGLGDVTRLIDFVKKRGVKAIFVESSVPHATIERIARDARVAIGGELFSDAMGVPGERELGYDVGTYEGMIKRNLTVIVSALK